jgi:hypothetical protein
MAQHATMDFIAQTQTLARLVFVEELQEAVQRIIYQA